MKNPRQLILIWVAVGLLIVIGIVLLVLMFSPGANTITRPTPDAFEKGASVTVTRFVLPPTWTAAPVQETEVPHPTANPLSTSTRGALIMPTAMDTLPALPTITHGPTVTSMPTITHVPLTLRPPTLTATFKPTATKKP